MNNGIIWKKLAALMLCTMFLLPSDKSEIKAEETGSLTLHCHITDEDGTRYFVNDTYAILPVADVEFEEGNAEYVMRDGFEVFDCEWSELSASQLKEKAKEIADEADFSTAIQAMTDDSGEVVFENLEPALYLVDRIEVAEENEDYSVDPMLISVPSFSDNEWVFDVVTTPKFSEMPEQTEEPKEPDTQLPATGQLKWPIPVLAVGGAVLIGSGLFLSIRRKEEGNNKQTDNKE